MKRWGDQKPARFDRKELKADLGSGNFIFVGSSCDMWAKSIPASWISETIDYCKKFDNSYLFQSKNPELAYLCESLLPEKSVLCTTIETNRTYSFIMGNTPTPRERASAIGSFSGRRFVTIEPILDFDIDPMVELIKLCNPEQVNIGADSGNNGLPEPHFEKVLELVERLKCFTTIAKKKNLDRLGNLTTAST
jgi:hypothetical protein